MLITVLLVCLLLFSLLLLLIFASALIGYWQSRVPFVLSPISDTRNALAVAGLRDGHTFFDIGSGNGRVVFVAEKFARVQATGFELTYWTHLWARLSAKRKRSSAQFVRSNFFEVSWANVDVIYCYLFPPLMRSVEEKFLSECKIGTVLISRDFALPNLKAFQVLALKNSHRANLYRKI